MTLKFKFTLYLIFVHLLLAGASIYLLTKHRILLIGVEVVFFLSIYIGVALIKKIFGSLKLISSGSEFIQDNEFTTRFRETGQVEVDGIIQIYNRMADNLREERTRLQEQNYFLEKVTSASPSGIITLDFDERIVMANPAAERLLNITLDEMNRKKLNELNGMSINALSDIKPNEARLISITGSKRVKCRRGQFMDRGFTRDFILLEELTEELRQTEKAAYERIIRLMSHEVNNTVGSANSLLHSCLNYSDQIKLIDRPDFDTAINVVISRTDQLNRFMRNFADIFRLPPPHKSDCNIVELLKSTIHLFKAELQKRNIDLIAEFISPPPQVSLDRGQMEHAFVNIFKNAMEAIGTNGTITVRISREAITIEDTGCGLSNNVRENLFTPFFSTKENGQGIGLTLVQEILDMHGFEFSLDTTQHQSTEFKINF